MQFRHFGCQTLLVCKGHCRKQQKGCSLVNLVDSWQKDFINQNRCNIDILVVIHSLFAKGIVLSSKKVAVCLLAKGHCLYKQKQMQFRHFGHHTQLVCKGHCLKGQKCCSLVNLFAFWQKDTVFVNRNSCNLDILVVMLGLICKRCCLQLQKRLRLTNLVAIFFQLNQHF